MHLTITIFLDPLDTTRLGVWILDGDPLHRSLLQYALTPKSVTNTVIVQVVDISRPWTIMESLHSWTEVLREHIHSLKLTPKDLNEMEERSKLHLNWFRKKKYFALCFRIEKKITAGVTKLLCFCLYSWFADLCSWHFLKVSSFILCGVCSFAILIFQEDVVLFDGYILS